MKTMAPQVDAVVKPGTVQRKCGCTDPAKCSCHEPEKEKPGTIQRRARGATAAAPKNSIAPAVTRGIQQTAGGGQSLPQSVRGPLEAGFGGRDLSNVRVHTDAHANQLADSLHAHAFTTGSNIYFAQNQYRPESPEGRRLLTHEVTHVVQQGNAPPTAIQAQLELGAVDTPAEREADRAADAIASGLTASPVVASPRTAVQRAAAATPVTQALDKGGQAITLPKTEPLELPAQKADSDEDLNYLLGIYKTAAANKRLRTTHAGRASGLWSIWAAGRQAVPNIGDYETRLHSKCSPDHMQELQVGGADNAANMRLLSQDRNEHAGSQIAGQLASLKNKYNIDANSWLEFTEVIAKPLTSATPDQPCLTGEEPLKRPAGATTIAKGLEALAFVAGGAPGRIGYEKNGEVPRVHRFAVAGAEMDKVAPQNDGTHVIHSMISSRIKRFPVQGTARNFDFKTDGPQPTGAGAPPKLLLANPGPLSLNFPKMSPATLTPTIEGGQWRATGELKPTLPVLNKSIVYLKVENEQLSGGIKLDPAAFKAALPVPGLTIDPVTLEIKIEDGEFSATGGFDFKYGTMATGSLTASFNKAGDFEATGTLDLLIPGLDKAQGKVWIQHGAFGGQLTVDTKQLTFPGVKAGHLSVLVANGVLTGTGTVDLTIPGLDQSSLTFHADSTGQYGIDGTATGKIPGLKDVRVDISYAKGGLAGKGHAGLIIPGLESASIDLVYLDGAFSGSATLAYKRGKLGGMVNAAISPQHKLSGRGELSYEIAPKLVVLVGITLREDGTSKIDGELKLPDPLIFFEEKALHHSIFKIPPIEFPIFAIPVGPKSIGVVGKIGAGLSASVGIGPGQIKNGMVLASFDPSKDEGALSFEASGIVYVPAHAGLTLSLDGSIGLDLLIVEADGTLGVSATAELLGELVMPVDLAYREGKFSIDSTATIGVRPHFEFRGHAGVRVYTDLLFTDITYYEHDWDLGGFAWDPDFKIALVFPVHYVFGEPFSIDTDQIQFIHPDFSVGGILKSLLPK
jgi:hypothetical protein